MQASTRLNLHDAARREYLRSNPVPRKNAQYLRTAIFQLCCLHDSLEPGASRLTLQLLLNCQGKRFTSARNALDLLDFGASPEYQEHFNSLPWVWKHHGSIPKEKIEGRFHADRPNGERLNFSVSPHVIRAL